MADWLTIDDVNALLGTKTQRSRQLMTKAKKVKKFVVTSQQRGVKIFYSAPAVQELVKLYHSGALGKVRSKATGQIPAKSIPKRLEAAADDAVLNLKAAISNTDIAKTLISKYGSVEELEKHLMDYLHTQAEPLVKELKKIEKDYETRKNALFNKAKALTGRNKK